VNRKQILATYFASLCEVWNMIATMRDGPCHCLWKGGLFSVLLGNFQKFRDRAPHINRFGRYFLSIKVWFKYVIQSFVNHNRSYQNIWEPLGLYMCRDFALLPSYKSRSFYCEFYSLKKKRRDTCFSFYVKRENFLTLWWTSIITCFILLRSAQDICIYRGLCHCVDDIIFPLTHTPTWFVK
jgi:hypothetical protein